MPRIPELFYINCSTTITIVKDDKGATATITNDDDGSNTTIPLLMSIGWGDVECWRGDIEVCTSRSIHTPSKIMIISQYLTPAQTTINPNPSVAYVIIDNDTDAYFTNRITINGRSQWRD
jgi:hypothetical protein